MFNLFIQAFTIAFSGALMPGPLLTVTIKESSRYGFIAGPLISVGHALLELVLIIGLGFGLGKALTLPAVTGTVGIAGGLVLFWMGWGMVLSSPSISLEQAVDQAVEDTGDNKSFWAGVRNNRLVRLAAAGIFISLINPYWSVWWATIGLKLLTDAIRLGAGGIAVFFVGHVLADFLWYTIISTAIARGKKMFSDQGYRFVIAFCGFFLLYLAVSFIVDGVAVFMG